MFTCRFYLICLVAILYICSCVGNSNVNKCVETDKQALLKFKAQLHDEYDFFSSWKGEDCCKWKGIACDNSTGHVTMLKLSGDFGGKIDSSLCELQHLTSLILSYNKLEGKIPECIGSLGQLTELSLAYNRLVGAIPRALGNLSNLRTLDLGDNGLVGVIPRVLGNLSNLQTLYLQNNGLVGAIPNVLGNLSNLRTLDLGDNGLVGVIPRVLGNLSNLQTLYLQNNGLVGAIPNVLGNLSNLRTLDLGDNGLVGVIPRVLGNLSNLQTLYLQNNGLVGAIPNVLGNLSNLQTLELGDNGLTGAIPNVLGNLSNLQDLGLGNNGFVGAIPRVLGNLSNLQTLDLEGMDFLVVNDLEWLPHLSNLKSLAMSYSNLSQAVDWQSSISKLLSLSSLQLDYCGLPQVNLNLIPQMNSSTSLKSISLSGNHLNSSILSWVLNVSKVLTSLDLSHNSLQHSIPEGFANMISLNTLDLSYNELEGGIPKSFQNFCQLQYLILSSNKLSGQLSDYVPRLCSSGIRELDLSHNQLNGSLPYTIGKLSNLYKLSIYSNNINGVVDEAHLSNLSRLAILEVDHTSLSFNISSSWVPPFQLTELSASSCILGPIFPPWLKHHRQLDTLQISNCGISGSIPKWFWDLSPRFLYLNVSRNKLSGALPKSINDPDVNYRLPEAEWDLSFNNFSGPLPQFPRTMGLLSISNNMFSGSISSVCVKYFPVLTYLDLSNNILEGKLPDCWAQLKILKVLNLGRNNFSGRIPKSLGSLHEIETIHLNNNNFSGEIPFLARCWKLKFIDFGDNNLGGTIPAWVGQNLHNLIVLRLRVNKFQGSIPASLCNLLHLQVLDISENIIIGKIPECLDQIISLTNMKVSREILSYSTSGYLISFEDYDVGWFIDGAIFAWKGANREYHGKNLGLLKSIDLSYNQLIGEIPLSVTKLAALVSLNLSGNNLTGFIPINIGHMKLLESLDLSRNYLHGIIPESLSNLTFLSVMNLSFNNLFGMIPISTQLETFSNSTYIGNLGLCGPPLSKGCSEDRNTHRNDAEGDDDDDDDELISFGFYISIGLGFIIGFWGVCGTLTLNTSWRYAYFQFFNNMNNWIYVQIVVFMARLKRRLQVQD